jgi:hypothetical protein
MLHSQGLFFFSSYFIIFTFTYMCIHCLCHLLPHHSQRQGLNTGLANSEVWPSSFLLLNSSQFEQNSNAECSLQYFIFYRWGRKAMVEAWRYREQLLGIKEAPQSKFTWNLEPSTLCTRRDYYLPGVFNNSSTFSFLLTFFIRPYEKL